MKYIKNIEVFFEDSFSKKERIKLLEINKDLLNLSFEEIDIKSELLYLKENNKTISVSESLTGGLLSAEFVNYSGVSKVFKGSITAYMLEIKESLLNIPLSHTIKTDGVDKITSQLMAKNVSEKMNSDFGISTTGIAEKYDEREVQSFISIYSKDLNTTITIQITLKNDLTRKEVRVLTVNTAILLFKKTIKIIRN